MSGSTSSVRLGPPAPIPARRIVSLVPSLTDAIFELGAGSAVVGRTDFCVRPVDAVGAVETVGGTKNPDVDHVVELAPDLVLANREENTRRRIERIAERVPVLVTDPSGPRDVPVLWRELGAAVGRSGAAEVLAREVERELDRCEDAVPTAPPTFVYWIWKDPWMAAGHETYICELLHAAGWRNALSRDRKRYPKLDPADALSLEPSALMFSSEPFDFSLPRDLEPFTDAATEDDGVWQVSPSTIAVAVDGQRLSWYPSLTASGLRLARRLRERL